MTRNGRSELWHTRARPAQGLGDRIALRAVHSPDFPTTTVQFPFNSTLSADQRRQIVRLTADFSLAAPSGAQLPRPALSDELMLSAMGGSLRLRASWNPATVPGQGLNLTVWQHLATLGRDHNVRLAELGSLLPFGHRVIKVTTNQREVFEGPAIDNKRTHFAVLRQREYLVIVEAEKRFDSPALLQQYTAQGREMPLRSVRIQIGETPDLTPGGDGPIGATGAFWVKVGTSDFQFPLAATDADGETFAFSAPMVFVPFTVEANPGAMAQIRTAYATNVLNDAPRRTAPVNGQSIAFAPRVAAANDAARLSTERVLFNLQAIAGSADAPPFLPLIEEVAARIPAVEAITGVAQASELRFFAPYLQGTVDGAANQVAAFMRLKQPLALDFPAETVGGLAKTALQMSGLSRTLGPLPGDLLQLAKGEFNPEAIFKDLASGLGAKLLGVLSLKDILSTFTGGADFLPSIPKLLSETKRLANNVPESVVTRFDWSPKLKDFGPFKARLPGAAAELLVKSTIEQRLEPGAQPTYQVEGTLKNFQIDFVAVLQVNFASLRFSSGSGQKTAVKTVLATPPIAMGGAYAFSTSSASSCLPDCSAICPR
ncbi:hypothetical protein HC891_19000 [Candidatus Gracilibacteria bacterium]|nr:hypothetical protein [Candidatus Gracilibacteria bacterium]